MSIMTFDSLLLIIALQGADSARCYLPDAARAVLSRWDETCLHFETDDGT